MPGNLVENLMNRTTMNRNFPVTQGGPWVCRIALACAVVAMATTTVFGQNSVPSARIAKFAGDRVAAISYTFDDNLRDQFTLAVPMLNEVSMKGTFFVIAGKTAETPEQGERKQENGNPRNLWGGISWPELKQMADQGHEIASHTWSHSNLTKLMPDDLDAQFRKACDAIKIHVGKPALTIAFPGNGSNPEVRAAALKHHLAYRGFQQSTGGKSTTQSLNAWADKLILENKWGVLMVHGIAKGYAPLSDPGILRAHLTYVKSREGDIWVDTFANVARYEKERENAKLRLTGQPGNLTCSLNSVLDPQIFNVPLTIVLDAPKATTARAVRAGKELPVRVMKGSIYIEAPPAVEPITITSN